MGDLATSTITQFPIQSHNPDTELTSVGLGRSEAVSWQVNIPGSGVVVPNSLGGEIAQLVKAWVWGLVTLWKPV